MAKIFHPSQLLRFVRVNQNFQKIQLRQNTSFVKDKAIDLGENTLTGRLLTYLNNFNTQDIEVNRRIKKLDPINLKTSNIKDCDIEQIKSSVKILDIDQDINSFRLLEAIDKECSSRIQYLRTSDIFELLHIYMRKVPNKILKYTFYEHAINELSRRLKILDRNDIVQLIFYVGLRKKMSRRHELIRRCINHLIKSNFKSLTGEDLCIICNSTFKTTTKINVQQLFSTIISYLYNNLELFKDPALLITLLKTIRQNRYQDNDLMNTMTNTIFFNKTLDYYSFSALAHILAVYSDYLYCDENILRVFAERCVKILKESKFTSLKEHMSTNVRLKDITRFLWCLSNLNYKLDANDIKSVIIPNILKRYEAGEHDDTSLIEITLYLWMLNYHAYELVPYCLTNENIEYINTLNTPIKQRLNLLLSCILCEDKEFMKKLNVQPTFLKYDMNKQLEKRPLLQKIITHVNAIAANHEINRFEVSCQIPGLHIVGVTGYKKDDSKAVHIEVLDEYTVLKNTDNMPTGPMQLKLRLLDQSDEALILIDSEELNSLKDNEIQTLLLDEIEFVC